MNNKTPVKTSEQPTILWHDYETWGIHPSVDFPVQFAAIRTDLDLNLIEDQATINYLCKIPLDYLPHPQACLVTGLTPFYSLNKGLSEPEFAQRIYKQISQANTCVAGYNSMKFDEEVTRHLLFRNLFPVYEREFKNNNSRWDVIDLVRACYALRPNDINWPQYEDGKPCFKLEALTKENGLEHEKAHDALSDVYATIAIAKLIKTKQPKLFEYYWQLRNKHKVNDLLQQFMANIFVHISAYINSQQGCCALIMPVCQHPQNRNAVLCIDLTKPIDIFLDNKLEQLQQALFMPAAELGTNQRPGLLSISVNKCPFIAPFKTITPQRANELNINLQQCLERFTQLKDLGFLASLCESVFATKPERPLSDNVDEHLYTSEFPSSADIRTMASVRHKVPEQLASLKNVFESNTLNRVLTRYKARNYPGILDEQEMVSWQQHIQARLTQGNKHACLSLNEFSSEIQELMHEYQHHPDKLKILHSLQSYAKQLAGV